MKHERPIGCPWRDTSSRTAPPNRWRVLAPLVMKSAGALFILTFGSLVSMGCSAAESPVDAVDEGELRASDKLTQCPATFDGANGAACSDALSCLYSFECGATKQQTRCSCEAGKLACNDRVGPIPVGEKQLCAPGSAADNTECPVSKAAAEGKTCAAAGRICAYRGRACHVAPDQPLLDWCRCSPNGAGGFAYNCGTVLCAPPP